MNGESQRTTIERIEYQQAFRFTRIFECFRTAIAPSRMLLALLLVVVIYAGGRLMDVIWGNRVVKSEFVSYVMMPTEEFNAWRTRMYEATEVTERTGVFDEALRIKLDLFQNLVNAAVNLRPGFDQLVPGAEPNRETVMGVLRHLLMLPAWLWEAHSGFLCVYLIIFTVLWSLLGGAISRHTMLEASANRVIPTTHAVAFAWKRWGWYLLAPLMPLAVVLALALIMAIGGWIAFNLPVINIVSALLLIVALSVGFVMALLLIGWFGAVHLMYPALGAEGTDAFDAMSRSFSYVFARPWRMILYSLIALVYGAATYIFVGLIAYLTLRVTHWALGAWVGDFDQIFPPPEFGRLNYPSPSDELPWHRYASAIVILVWVYLTVGVVIAYAISYYFSAYSVIYLLLRQYTDGTDPAEVYEEPEPAPAETVQDKVEPGPAAESKVIKSAAESSSTESTAEDSGDDDDQNSASSPDEK